MRDYSLKRATLGLILLFLLLPLVWSGCSPPKRVPKADPGNEKIELEFWTLQMLTFSDYITGMIAEYERMHPEIKIKWVDVPFSEGEKKALTSMLARQTPDVINLNPDFSAILASRGALLDMNQWVDPEHRASYLPVAWQAASLGDKTFGLPWYVTSAVTLYNRTLLKAAHYDAPPKSYEEMARMAQDLRGDGSGYLLMPSVSEGGRFFRVLQKQGIEIWNSAGKLAFADNGNQAGKELRFWVGLYEKGLVPKESITEGQQAAVDRYQSGTLGLLLTGPNFLNIVRENAPQIFQSTEVAPQFPIGNGFIDFSEMILVVPKQTPHPKEAVDFALFITNTGNTLKLSELAPVLPPHREALQAERFQQMRSPNLLDRARSISAQQLLQAKTALQIHPMQNRLNQLMDFYVQSALLGKLTPEAAMLKAQQEMNKLMQ